MGSACQVACRPPQCLVFGGLLLWGLEGLPGDPTCWPLEVFSSTNVPNPTLAYPALSEDALLPFALTLSCPMSPAQCPGLLLLRGRKKNEPLSMLLCAICRPAPIPPQSSLSLNPEAGPRPFCPSLREKPPSREFHSCAYCRSWPENCWPRAVLFAWAVPSPPVLIRSSRRNRCTLGENGCLPHWFSLPPSQTAP